MLILFLRCSFAVCEHIADKSADGIIVFVNCATATVLKQHSAFRHLLNIVVVRESCKIDSVNIFKGKPSCQYTNSLLSDIAGYKSWRDILLYKDDTFGKY
jgi:hypothetical protein